ANDPLPFLFGREQREGTHFSLLFEQSSLPSVWRARCTTRWCRSHPASLPHPWRNLMKKPLTAAALLAVCAAVLWAQSAVRPQEKKDDARVIGKGADGRAVDEKALLEALYAYQQAFNR